MKPPWATHRQVHLALPAAALDAQQRPWRTLPQEQGYLFNQRALAAVMRGKLLAPAAWSSCGW